MTFLRRVRLPRRLPLVAQSGPRLAAPRARPMRARPPHGGGSALFVIRTAGCFSTFSLPLTIVFQWGEKVFTFLFLPPNLAINNSSDVVTHRFPLSPEGVFCLFKATCFLVESRVSQSSCDGSIPPSPPTGSSSASGWRWELQVCAWPARVSARLAGPGDARLGQPPA